MVTDILEDDCNEHKAGWLLRGILFFRQVFNVLCKGSFKGVEVYRFF